MAFGDVSLTVNPDGWSGYLEVEGFSVGATYNFGLGAGNADIANARLVLSIVSPGFNATIPTTWTRISYGKGTVRRPWPNNTTKDESLVEDRLRTRIAFSMPVFVKDKAGEGNSGTDIVATVLAGLVINTGGGGQVNNPAASITVTNNSTLTYPKVVGRWAQPGFERWTGDKLVEFVCFHPFARDGKPVSCVAFDCSDGTFSAAQQVSTAMTASKAFPGEANTVWTYSATIPVANLSQGATATVRARCYPWIGDSSSILDTDVSADGIAAPHPLLTPLMGYVDKLNTKAVYVSLNPTTTGIPQPSSSKETARANSYASLATAFTAAKTYNNAVNGVNTLDNVYVLCQNGNYTAAGTFLGNNTLSWCTIQADTENGASKSGVVFNTPTNQVFTGYLKYENVSFAGTASGMFRGSATLGQLWLDHCAFGYAAGTQWYAWLAAYMTRTVFTAGTQNLSGTTNNPVAWALVRGNDLTALTSKSAHSHCLIGNKNLTVNCVATGLANGPQADGSFIGWNSAYSLSNTVPFVLDNITDNTLKGMAFVGNVAERIGGTTAAFVRFVADSGVNIAANNIYFAHNTILGARFNSNYLEVGNYAPNRLNWYDFYNCLEENNVKADVFQSANTPPGRIVSDGVITAGSPIVSSATANFIAGDVGQNLSFEQLPDGITTVKTLISSTSVELNASSLESATGVTFYIRSYGRDSRRVSNWSWLNGCGVIGSRYRQTNFPRDNDGINTSIGPVAFVSDRSLEGTGTGGGDYRPANGSTLLNLVPAGGAVLPGDLNGRPISNLGSASAGALQLRAAGRLLLLRRKGMR